MLKEMGKKLLWFAMLFLAVALGVWAGGEGEDVVAGLFGGDAAPAQPSDMALCLNLVDSTQAAAFAQARLATENANQCPDKDTEIERLAGELSVAEVKIVDYESHITHLEAEVLRLKTELDGIKQQMRNMIDPPPEPE